MRTAMTGDPAPVVTEHARRIAVLVSEERYEEAAAVRDRLATFLRGAARVQRLAPLARTTELCAARRSDDGGWELVLVRYGRLAATALVPPRTDPLPVVDSLRATAEHVPAPIAPAPAGHPEEADLILAWLSAPGVRLVSLSEPWSVPVRSAAAWADPAAAIAALVPSSTAPRRDVGTKVSDGA